MKINNKIITNYSSKTNIESGLARLVNASNLMFNRIMKHLIEAYNGSIKSQLIENRKQQTLL